MTKNLAIQHSGFVRVRSAVGSGVITKKAQKYDESFKVPYRSACQVVRIHQHQKTELTYQQRIGRAIADCLTVLMKQRRRMKGFSL